MIPSIRSSMSADSLMAMASAALDKGASEDAEVARSEAHADSAIAAEQRKHLLELQRKQHEAEHAAAHPGLLGGIMKILGVIGTAVAALAAVAAAFIPGLGDLTVVALVAGLVAAGGGEEELRENALTHDAAQAAAATDKKSACVEQTEQATAERMDDWQAALDRQDAVEQNAKDASNTLSAAAEQMARGLRA